MTSPVRAVAAEESVLVSEEEFDEAVADTSPEAVAAREATWVEAEAHKVRLRKRAERRAEQLLREEDAAGEAPLRSSLLDFAGLMDLPDPRWLVGDLLPEVSLAFLAGQPGVYKSFFALHVAVGVATGTDVFGGAALQGDVLYVAAEGAPGQKARGVAQALRLGEESAALYDRFRLLARPIDLLNERHVDQLVEIVEERDTRLVIIDTLARCTPGAEENSNTVMGQAVAALSRVRDAGDGRAVYVVHHSVKTPGGSPLRGAGATLGAADAVHHITRAEGSPFVSVATAKQKDAEERAPFTLEFTKTGASGVLTEASNLAAANHRVQAGGQRMDMILVLLMSKPGQTMADLVLATGVPRVTLNRDVSDLISRGHLERKKVGGVFRHYVVEAES